MNRRQYLAGVTGSLVAFAGCPLTDSSEQAETRGEAETFEERTVSLVGVDEEPSYLDVSVEVVESQITAAHTATVRLSLENVGSRESSIGIDRRPEPISSTGPDDSDGASTVLSLVPTGSTQPDPIDGCWKTERAGGPWNGSAGGQGIRLSPGRSYTNEYLLWDSKPDSRCMPPGEYQFDMPGWMFTFSLEKPA